MPTPELVVWSIASDGIPHCRYWCSWCGFGHSNKRERDEQDPPTPEVRPTDKVTTYVAFSTRIR
ncbi:MAG: hypothetical protein ACLR5N_08455 [Haemophilus parainfluenzae]